MDLMGPWYKDSTWPAVWQNLNIQSQYSPYYIAGYNDMAMSMLNYYADNMETLAYNTWREQQGLPNPDPVKGWYYSIGGSASNLALGKSTATAGSSPGDFLYAMNNLWQQYRATMDDEMLREKLFPLLKGAFNQIETIFTMHEDDGKYHIDIPTWSPEWEATVDGVITSGYTTDTNYVLALSKWLAQVIIEANDRLDLDDEVAVRAKELYDNITPYQVDESGFMVGAETWVKKDGVMTKIKDATPFSRSHRHWSHLFMIYPLYEYTYDNIAMGTWYVRVAAMKEGGLTDYSEVVSFVMQTPSAVEDIQESNQPIKVIENGRVLIYRNGKRYNLLGGIAQ